MWLFVFIVNRFLRKAVWITCWQLPPRRPLMIQLRRKKGNHQPPLARWSTALIWVAPWVRGLRCQNCKVYYKFLRHPAKIDIHAVNYAKVIWPNKSFPRISQDIFLRQMPPKGLPFPRKQEQHAASCAFEWGGGGGGGQKSQLELDELSMKIKISRCPERRTGQLKWEVSIALISTHLHRDVSPLQEEVLIPPFQPVSV